VDEALIGNDDLRGRGGIAQHECGRKAVSRTVVVYITLRGFLPSASLSERVSFVSHFRSGWRVWEIAH
jgi:RNase P/RNase MRP subunit p30